MMGFLAGGNTHQTFDYAAILLALGDAVTSRVECLQAQRFRCEELRGRSCLQSVTTSTSSRAELALLSGFIDICLPAHQDIGGRKPRFPILRKRHSQGNLSCVTVYSNIFGVQSLAF